MRRAGRRARWVGRTTGNGRSPAVKRAAVAHTAADEREDDVLGGVQRGECPDPERGRVVGDEQDLPGHSAPARRRAPRPPRRGSRSAGRPGTRRPRRPRPRGGSSSATGRRCRIGVASTIPSVRPASAAAATSARRGPSPSRAPATGAAARARRRGSRSPARSRRSGVRRASSPGRRRVTGQAACEANACAGCASCSPKRSATSRNPSRKPGREHDVVVDEQQPVGSVGRVGRERRARGSPTCRSPAAPAPGAARRRGVSAAAPPRSHARPAPAPAE